MKNKKNHKKSSNNSQNIWQFGKEIVNLQSFLLKMNNDEENIICMCHCIDGFDNGRM